MSKKCDSFTKLDLPIRGRFDYGLCWSGTHAYIYGGSCDTDRSLNLLQYENILWQIDSMFCVYIYNNSLYHF